jgi:hypothetical protein
MAAALIVLVDSCFAYVVSQSLNTHRGEIAKQTAFAHQQLQQPRVRALRHCAECRSNASPIMASVARQRPPLR